MEQTLRVCVFGSTGYTAQELLRVLQRHPHVNIVSLVSSSSASRKLAEVLPQFCGSPLGDKTLEKEPSEDFDLAFLCLPHEASLEEVPKLIQRGKKVIDLSGAYRLKSPNLYQEFYNFTHAHPEILQKAIYGLPEAFRDKIKKADLVANPGCYPTATLLAILPLLKEGLIEGRIVVHALSGVSGAGRKLRQHFHYPEMEGDFFPYSVEKHRHTPEMEEVIYEISGKSIKVRFTPTVVPSVRGMVSTVYFDLKEDTDLQSLFEDFYREETFVKVLSAPPHPKWVLGTNMCLLYPFYDAKAETGVVISAIDNLGKGASQQAVQNMNLMFGFEETTALERVPLIP